MNRYQLRLKVLIGMSLFLLLVGGQALYQLDVLQQTEANHALLGELNQVEARVEVFPRRSENYLANAARDFDSYFRDVRVFYKDLLDDFSQFDQSIDELHSRFMLGDGSSDWMSSSVLEERARRSLADSLAQWQRFHAGFIQALGENKQEPLLEAGARYVVAEHPALRSQIKTMISDYRSYLNEQAASSRQALHISLGLTAILGLFGLIWFYRRVMRRIGATADACQIVASGDFGYTLPSDGDDEIGQLNKAFNTLSSRTHLVLEMMARMQDIETIEHGLALIVQASGSYLPVAWAGYLSVNDGEQLLLSHAIPPKSLQGWNARGLTTEEPFGQQLQQALIGARAFSLNQLSEHVLAHPDENFLRALSRASKLESVLALPLSNGRGWQAMILFGSRNSEYRADQVELLNNMAGLIAAGFERIARDDATRFAG